MAGWDNDIAYSNNADYSTAGATGGSLANGLITDGELWIGRTALNAGGTHISVGNLTSPDASITFGYSAPNITAVVNAGSLPYYSLTPYIVGQVGDIHAQYFTIQSAIDAAVGDGASDANPKTVKIKPGTYAENLTLRAGVSLTGQGCDPYSPSVTITGVHTYSGSGNVTIANVAIDPNSTYAITVTGSSAITFTLYNCRFMLDGGETVLFNQNTNTDTKINFISCFSDSGAGTGGIIFTQNPDHAGSLLIDRCYFSLTGGTANALSMAVTVNCSFISVGFLVSGTGSSIQVYNSTIGTPSTNGPAIAIGVLTDPSFVYNSVLFGGTQQAITMSSGGGTASLTLSSVSISSSNTNCIESLSGTNTIIYDEISFIGTSSGISGVIETLRQFIGAKVRANGLAYLNGGTAYAYTGQAGDYQVLVSDVIIGITSTASARTVTMPNTGMTIGQRWTIKDESGGAASNNITISGNGANIDGSSTFVMASNFQSVDIYWNGTNFFIV